MNERIEFNGFIREPMSLSILESNDTLVFLFGEYHGGPESKRGSSVAEFAANIKAFGIETVTIMEISAHVKLRSVEHNEGYTITKIQEEHVARGINVVRADPRDHMGKYMGRKPIEASNNEEWQISRSIMIYEKLTGYNIETMAKVGNGILCSDTIKKCIAQYGQRELNHPDIDLCILEAGLLDLIVLAEIESRYGAIIFYGGDAHRKAIRDHLIQFNFKSVYDTISIKPHIVYHKQESTMYGPKPREVRFVYNVRGIHVNFSFVPTKFDLESERDRYFKQLELNKYLKK